MPTNQVTKLAPVIDLFGKKFKDARRNSKLTQRDIHRLTGIAVSYVSAVERCQRNLSLAHAETLAQAVNQPLHKLLTP